MVTDLDRQEQTLKRMLLWLVPGVLCSVGCGLLILAFAYAVVFVSVPFPDPTPEQAAWERFHNRVAGWLGLAGALVTVLALVVAVGVGVWVAVRRGWGGAG